MEVLNSLYSHFTPVISDKAHKDDAAVAPTKMTMTLKMHNPDKISYTTLHYIQHLLLYYKWYVITNVHVNMCTKHTLNIYILSYHYFENTILICFKFVVFYAHMKHLQLMIIIIIYLYSGYIPRNQSSEAQQTIERATNYSYSTVLQYIYPKISNASLCETVF